MTPGQVAEQAQAAQVEYDRARGLAEIHAADVRLPQAGG
jgi:hypothetical protein